MLDLWRPPPAAGDPIGCLATTYTFAPGLFDEQCLARFLEIESEPSREDLAFLLERESRLGSVYVGVLVDHTQAGVEHSLRWDVLPVRIQSGKQHAKISMLAWAKHVRIIVASANLTEPGYRYNYEVGSAVELTPGEASGEILADAVSFFRSLLALVPGKAEQLPEVSRAQAFVKQVERQVRAWKPVPRRGVIRQHLVFTLPSGGPGRNGRSSLEEGINLCRRRGASPTSARVASPFFDTDDQFSRVTAALCKLMARGRGRELSIWVPAIKDAETAAVPRLAAPKSLLLTPLRYGCNVQINSLPDVDGDRNRRSWHAKMLALRAEKYAALMVGSSNFTCAGMGVGGHRNAEANLITIVDRVAYGRKTGDLESLWPKTQPIADLENAEWLGARDAGEEEEQQQAPPLPAGFLSATYRAGDERQVVLQLDPAHLPPEWSIHACGQDERQILSAAIWRKKNQGTVVDLPWAPVQPPSRLLVQWPGHEAFLPLNVEDSSQLPAPPQLDEMSADDMLTIIAASDPSAAFRAWARPREATNVFDADIDSATPMDLDPLHRYDLHATFLHRVRRRARILAQLRAKLQQPVAGRRALDWRLRGLIGVKPVADRLLREFTIANSPADEALLTLSDFLIVLREVDYQPTDGFLSKKEFGRIFRSFLNELAEYLTMHVDPHSGRVSEDTMLFWNRVVERCRG